jgi:two-component system chemotaxis response regulator CheY
MVVEDDETIRNLYSVLLKSSGYEVIEATDGQDALTKNSASPCDMVITDMNMPRMGGMQLIESLRLQNPNIYIIMITAYGTTETPREALKRGTNEYFHKPFEVEDLRDRINDYFAGQIDM